jgi:prepilin-type N-terminal cleavage/methylation domain-containing protein
MTIDNKYTFKGFTLIELMVTISISAILLGLALPSFQTMIINNKIRTQSNSFISALKLARSEAIRRNTYVGVCPSNTNQDGCNENNAWSNGWLVIVINDLDDFDITDDIDDTDDSDGDGLANEVVRVWDAADGVAEDTIDAVKLIEYNSDGRASDLNGQISDGSAFNGASFIVVKDNCSGENKRTINIKKSGRASATLSACP